MRDPHLSAASVAGMLCSGASALVTWGFGVSVAPASLCGESERLRINVVFCHSSPTSSLLSYVAVMALPPKANSCLLVFGGSSEVGLISLFGTSFSSGPWMLVLSTDLLSYFLKA